MEQNELNGDSVFAATGEALKKLWNEWLPEEEDRWGRITDHCPAITWQDVKIEFRSMPAKEVKSYHLINYTEPVMFFHGDTYKHHRIIDAEEDDHTFSGDMSKYLTIRHTRITPVAKYTIGDLFREELERREKETHKLKDGDGI